MSVVSGFSRTMQGPPKGGHYGDFLQGSEDGKGQREQM